MAKGFTLLEILLVMAIAGVLVGLAAPILFSYQANNDLHLAEISIKQTVRQAQTQARNGVSDDDWGIYVVDGGVTLFKGNDYATRDTSYDLDIEIAGNISVTGLDEVYFAKETGLPDTTGTVTISVYDDSFDIIINEKGGIE